MISRATFCAVLAFVWLLLSPPNAFGQTSRRSALTDVAQSRSGGAIALVLSPDDLKETNLTRVLDAAIVDVMSTPTFAPFLDSAFGCDSGNVQFYLGVSPEAASVLLRDCVRSTRQSGFQKPRNTKVWMLRYHANHTLSGYTDAVNRTEIIFDSNRPVLGDRRAQTRLAVIIAHEIAIYFDNLARPPLVNVGYDINWRFVSHTPELQRMFATLEHPLIRDTFAAMRAYQVERDVLRELATRFPAHYEFSSASYTFVDQVARDPNQCLSEFKSIARQIFPAVQLKLRLHPWIEPSFEEPTADLRIGIESSYDEFERSRAYLLNHIATSTIPLADGRRIPFCQELSRARLGLSNNRISFGPRPTGRGGGG